jgi:glutathione S-transferase
VILIGQYDSPFVRRVAVTLRLYDLAYEHRPWSVWGDAEKIAEHNPLRRVPTLLLDDGVALLDTNSILDALDERVGPARALLPDSGPVRREGLRLAALSTGLADKGVSLLYETLFHPTPSAKWSARCASQIEDTLALLEKELAGRSTRYFLGETLSHPDVAFACAFRFVREAHPERVDTARYSTLAALSDDCEGLPAFQAAYLPITNNL